MQGQIIKGRYKIDTVIGRGGMAYVYKAFDAVLQRPVAVKILHNQFTTNAHFIERFRREAYSAASLIHPNITTIYDTGNTETSYYIVMEFVKGKTLKQIIDERAPLTVHEAVHIVKQVTEALAIAHSRRIIHRDIKPQNILISEDGMVKVTDFGIARALMMPGLTQTGKVLGTARYLSPEQARGLQADHRSDMYSLGVILFEMVTGQALFEGSSSVEVAGKHISETPPHPCSINPHIPFTLEVIIERLLRKDPDERYQDINKLLDDLSYWDSPEKLDLMATMPPQSRSEKIRERKRRVIEITPEWGEEPIPLTRRERHDLERSNRRSEQSKRRGARKKKLTPFAKTLIAVSVIGCIGFGLRALENVAIEPEDMIKQDVSAVAVVPTTAVQGEKLGVLNPVEVTDYDPNGNGDENPSQLANIFDGNPTTAWSTESYKSASFNNQKGGTGVYIDYGAIVSLKELDIRSSGHWAGEIKGSNDILAWDTIKQFDNAESNMKLTIKAKNYRYYLIWINQLAKTGGTYRCKIYEVQAIGSLD
ncbi:MAG TPA: protein kinase [Candidatus Aquicultor sp.]|jgi:serine/threonine-protein kinase